MRLRHPDGQTVYLGYCTNVHPAEDLAGILAQLDRHASAVRRNLDSDVLGLGLWLPAQVAAALADVPAWRRRLRRELDLRGLEVVTLNGVPCRSPLSPAGRHAEHQPDWTSRERLEYTLNLARVLADLLPPDAACGSVSTVPPTGPGAPPPIARLLDELAEGLTEVAWRTGRLIRVGFEPQPGSAMETTEQAVSALRQVDTDRIGISLDLAHLACAWEDPRQALDRLGRAGLPIVKVQVSSALQADDPSAASEALRPYAEPRLRLQTRGDGGEIAEDVATALADKMPGHWRVHYHGPVHTEPEPPLATTLPALRDAFDALVGGATAVCDHFDVETHTWEVPPNRTPLAEGLSAFVAAELKFCRDELLARGLTPCACGDGRQ